jgi:hypothetical protein
VDGLQGPALNLDVFLGIFSVCFETVLDVFRLFRYRERGTEINGYNVSH